ncbi:MAG: hypothetical protein H6701_13120 [Myxococcales bacterium]|nr:hypothetical protein [Myxococcales bacterium]
MTHHTGTIWLLAALFALAGCDDDDDGGGAGGSGGGDAHVDHDGAGGMGGEGGMGGAEQDAEPPPLDMSDLPDADTAYVACVEACDGFMACVGDRCPGATPATLRAECMTACEGNASFAAVLRGTDNCQDTVGFVAQQSAAIAAACDTDLPPPPEEPLCADYAARARECLIAVCPPAAELGPGAEVIFRNECNEQVADGTLPREALANIGAAACDNPLIAPLLDFLLTGGGGEDAPLAALCEDGPATDGVTCAEACGFLAMCIPEGTPEDMGGALRDEEVCRLLCGVGVGELQPANWHCFADANNCGALVMCVQNPPPIEPDFDCSGFAARATECIAETCPPAERFEADLPHLIDYLCREAVDDGVAEPEALAAIGPDTPCDHEALVGAVSFFTQVDPEDDDSGLLVGICAGDEPPQDPALCAAACAELSPCIPPGTPEDDGGALADPALCRFYCTLDPELPGDIWQCIDDAPDCGAIFACFPAEPDEPPPPEPMR